MISKALKLWDTHFDNWQSEIEDRRNYRDMAADEKWSKYWISFDSVLALPGPPRVYCGITSFCAEIFKAYDRTKRSFVDLGYAAIADPYDAKFHRSLLASRDGCLYGAIALLHDVDRYGDAPGGAIVRYNPLSGEIRKIGIPLPHVYIQSMAIDEEKRLAYCQTFTPEYLVSFHLDSCESRILGLTGSGIGMGQGENIVIDRRGRVWGGWSVTRAWQNEPGVDQHRLYVYDPEGGKIDFLDAGLPHLNGRPGYAHLDGMIAADDGRLYAGSGEGGLVRIDPDSRKIELLGAPVPPARIAAFAMGPDGDLYGIGGRYGNASLFRLELKSGTYSIVGKIVDSETGVSPWQIHDMSFAEDGTIFAGENDNPYRSSYLWEIHPEVK
jgi:sugar lactone lactonase YvrE